ARVQSYNPMADLSILEKACNFARQMHRGQYRDSGESYYHHPLEVAKILAELELDVVTITAGLLHDVLEDTKVTPEELEESFGEEVLRLVDGVTKLSKIPTQSKEEQQAENLRKMFLAMAKDLRVILIKLADRLHNMRTLRYLPPERQRKIAKETLEIYTPLAHRLGMWSLKWEMEDLALRFLDPQEYYRLVELVASQRQEREGNLQLVLTQLREKLDEVGIKAELQGRNKHFYGIYHKMQTQGKDFHEVYDLMGVRVLVETVKDCYGVLGIVHTLWKPVPGRFKDYVAMPKSNMYQSLHTTVIGPVGEPVEIQIRTHEMHRVAEKGIAAHWIYKEGGKANQEFEAKMAWLREVMEWLKDMKDPQEFMETLKIDLFEDEVFVFTPKGDVKSLPAGATPIDFAFSVHTAIGLQCNGAKVDGRLVPLDYKLKNGEFVEILTSKHASPSQDWLGFVKTSKARNKIRAWLKESQKEESIIRGRESLEKEGKKYGLEAHEVLKTEKLAEAAKRFGFVAADDLLASIGFGKVTAAQALGRIIGTRELEAIRQEMRRQKRKPTAKGPRGAAQGIEIKGIDNVLVRISKCCNPVPGDKIVGYITRGRGVSVHRADCPNITALEADPQRMIDVRWSEERRGTYPVEIHVEAFDKENLLTNIMTAVSEQKTTIEGVNARINRQRMAYIDLVVDISGVEQMKAIMDRIRQVDGVVEVYRAFPT
ncbi:MAG: RelA/SpoT family protein, partial [Limnochordia bacterium]